ncbi:hypothetical protein TNCV_660311 [Trichonephila clavipes]|nr:hypothetical protein TNCV_660311 [Trichonephila clavipes]
MVCELIPNHCRPRSSPGSLYHSLVRCPIDGYQSPQNELLQNSGIKNLKYSVIYFTLHPIREQPLSSKPKTHHPDEEHKARLPDSIA